MIRIGPTEETIVREITDSISNLLNSVGMFYRVFSRIKSKDSIAKKIALKEEEYTRHQKKIQDVIGIRVTVYFYDDEEVAMELLKTIFEEITASRSVDNKDRERFGPSRKNLVFKIDRKLTETSALFDEPLIDATFEVQFRTVFSEGWHEVEHDLRYKCKKDWGGEDFLSRQLNGQSATLETVSWAMIKIFDELAYTKYKSQEWSSFLRNALRIRFEDDNLSATLIDFFNSHKEFAKHLLKMERDKLMFSLNKLPRVVPLKMDNVVYIINRFHLKNEHLESLEPNLLKQIFDTSVQ